MRCPGFSKSTILIGGAFFYSFYNLLLTHIHRPQEVANCPSSNPKNLLQTYQVQRGRDLNPTASFFQTHSQLQKPFSQLSSTPLNWVKIRVLSEPSKNFCDTTTLFVIHSSPENSAERFYLRDEIFAPSIKQGVSSFSLFSFTFYDAKNWFRNVFTLFRFQLMQFS